MKSLLLALTLLLPIAAGATPQSDYAKIEVARNALAVTALREAFDSPNGHKWEYGGAIFLVKGKYVRWTTPPRTSQANDHLAFDLREMMPSDAILVAIYHTHPCMPESHYPSYFSPPDMALVLFFHTTSYILDECTGDVHKFDILVDKLNDLESPIKQSDGDGPLPFTPFLVLGPVIGNIGAKGENLDLLPPEPVKPDANQAKDYSPQPPKNWRKTFRKGAWGQGENPGAKCPAHTIAFYIIADDGTAIFLECMREHRP